MEAKKVITIILVIILVLALCFYAIVNGIIGTIVNFFNNLVGNVIDGALTLWEDIRQFFGFSVVKNGMYIYSIDKSQVSALKDQLESEKIDTDKSGITETMLRKILLTQAVTSSTQDTLCVAEIGEDEIIQDTDYTNLNDYFATCTKKHSKDEWPISDYKYDLYYITDNFFYFKDEDNMVGNGENLYYLGVLGKTNVVTETGDAMEYVSNTEFKEIKSRYEQKGNKEGSQEEFDLLHHYTIDNNGQMKIYKIVQNENTYKYIFNRNDEELVNEERLDKSSTYNVVEMPLDIQNTVDSSQYAVSVELLINFLNLTGSPQYVDEFIDYALENTKVTIKGYSINNEEIAYSKNTSNIDDNFIFEAYDMVDGGIDDGKDNMSLYKELIFDRVYQGRSFTGSVVDLPNFEDIDYGTADLVVAIDLVSKALSVEPENIKQALASNGYATEQDVRNLIEVVDLLFYPFGTIEEETKDDFIDYVFNGGQTIRTAKISDYLKCAYDPGTGFTLGNVNTQEITINRRYETSWEFYISSISTWYGDITYEDPIKTRDYSIDAVDCTESEYNNFDYNDLTDYESANSDENTHIFIFEDRANEAGIQEGGTADVVSTADILSSILNKDISDNKNGNFIYWRLRGLGLISTDDEGQYNSNTGAGNGSDYLYIKYSRSDLRQYSKTTKYATDNVEMSTNLPKVSVDKVYDFLALWKNETGTIGDTNYKSEGIKVKYDDIYAGKTEVGDIFESAPEMTFELLESSESTKSLVDIFKYIMYIYTGIDYGITDASQIGFIFGTVPYSGSDYNVNTTLSSSELVLSKDKLEEAINKTYSGKTKENLLSCLDDFIYIQENNKVNAVFAVAVTIIESSGGTNWSAIDPSTYNWYSIKGSYNGNSSNGWRVYSSFNESVRDFGNLIANGSYYFKAGKFTVSTIAPTYCNETWGNSVIAEMTKIYNSIGITGATGGTEGSNGSYTTFTVGSRTYINYKQLDYPNVVLKTSSSGRSIKDVGCAITSDAIIASGFGNSATPIDVNNLNSDVHPSILQKLTGQEWIQYRSFNKTDVINELKKGNPVIVRYKGNGGFARSSSHFVAILSISEDGSKMYVSNPASRKDGISTGWLKTSYLDASGYCEYIKLK